MRPALLPFVALACFIESATVSADSPANVPCKTIAGYLEQFVARTPSQIDAAEFPDNALAVQGGPVEALAPQSFDSLTAAVRALGNPSRSDGRHSLIDGTDLWDGDQETQLFDLRPYNTDIVVLYQEGLSRQCDLFALFKLQDGTARLRSKPRSEELGGDGDFICAKGDGPSSWLGALRVDQTAYPVIWQMEVGPRILDDQLALQDADGHDICRVGIYFNPKTDIGDPYIAPAVDAAFAHRIRSLLEPLLATDQSVSGALKTYAPKPTGNSPYDQYADDSNDRFLSALDPTGMTSEVPSSDRSGLELHAMPIPFVFEGHALLLSLDRPWLGERQLPDNAFGVWEWTGGKLEPVMGGQMNEVGTRPTIGVY